MSRPSFFVRFCRGHLKRWEQALVGGVAGLIVAIQLNVGFRLSSSVPPGPDTLSFTEGVLTFGAILGGIGLIYGAAAQVNPAAWGYDPAGKRLHVIARVWPKPNASRRSLRALGRALNKWKKCNPPVTELQGLDRLRQGCYPRPGNLRPYVPDLVWGEEIPWPCPTPEGVNIEYRNMRVVDPWLHCPVLIIATTDMTSHQAVDSLVRAIPPELVRIIGFPDQE